VTVVTAGELHDEIAPGEGARHADRAHDRLGAGGDEPHLLGGRVGSHDALGKLHLRRAGCAIGHAARERFGDGGDDRRVRMTGDQRPPRAYEIEVSVAVGVEYLRARRVRDEQRCSSYRAKRAHR